MKKSIINTLLIGAGCSVVGLVCGLYIRQKTSNENYFWVSASIAAFLTSAALWWQLIEKASPNTMIRGAGWIRGGIVGGLAGFVAHFVCWVIHIHPTDLVLVASVFVFSFISLTIFGLVTIPAGILVGSIIERWKIGRL